MTLRGIIENGKIVVEHGELPPEGTRVDVTVKKTKSPKTPDSLANLGRFAVRTATKDLADEHDHYAHGLPKRKTAKAPSPNKRASPRTRRP